MMNFLLTGGAGYIGTQMSHLLVDKGHNVSIIDDLSNGTTDFLPKKVCFFEGNYGDKNLIEKILKKTKPDIIIHFAGNIIQYESFEQPMMYYENNLINGFNFFKACINNNLKNFIISSTAAVYGGIDKKFLNEQVPTHPVSPYGRSKLAFEWLLSDLLYKKNINYIFLRYFNVAGADLKNRCGEVGKKSSHLIKILVEYINSKRDEIKIFGDNFKTKDGTCIRDYIHICDLVDAHFLAGKYLIKNKKSNVFNLGSGKGFSVMEIIKKAEKIFNKEIKIKLCSPRIGDTARLVADSKNAKKKLNWNPKFSTIETILRTASQWEEKLTKK